MKKIINKLKLIYTEFGSSS